MVKTIKIGWNSLKEHNNELGVTLEVQKKLIDKIQPRKEKSFRELIGL